MREFVDRASEARAMLLRTAGAALVLVSFGACAGESGNGATLITPFFEAPSGSIAPYLVVSPDLLPAADPRLGGFDGWPLRYDARFHRVTGARFVVTLERDGATLREVEGSIDADSCSAVWDGLDAEGAYVSPGPLTAVARIVDASGVDLAAVPHTIEVVRLGVERVELGGDAGARQPLLFRRTAGMEDGWYEVGVDHIAWQIAPDRREAAGGAPLELPDGTARELPGIPEDLLSPALDPTSPDGVEHDSFAVPTAWVAGSRVDASLLLTSSIAGAPAGGGPTLTAIRVRAPAGFEFEGDESFADGSALLLRSTTSPVPGVGRYDVALDLTFEARSAEGDWLPIPGSFSIPLRLYGLVAAPVFGSTSLPHRPWVDIVDRVATWVDGSTADSDEVAARIVSGVYYELGLRYDTARGASFYTRYTSGFGGAVFYAQEFQERSLGNIVNCTDSASIVSTHANMMGIDVRYHILRNRSGGGFDLNYIQAIGMPAFDDTPFDSGRGGFSYHAILGGRDGRTWDATLAVDGDGTPDAPPHLLTLVQGMDATGYLQALSSQWDSIRVDYDDFVRLR